jgi:twinkle protein
MAKLAEKHTGVPFWDGPTRRMTPPELEAAFVWGRERFFFIRAEDDAPTTIEWILERARAAVLRHGVNGVGIDPYNEIEHRRPANMTETEYISQGLGKAKRFAVNHGVHV